MTDCVRLTIVDGVADVRLNRPDKLNGLDLAMFDALVETGKRVAEDRTLRAVVLSGEGRGFCAGLDFMSFMASSDGPKRGTPETTTVWNWRFAIRPSMPGSRTAPPRRPRRPQARWRTT